MRVASSAAHSRSLAAIFSIAGPVIRDTGPDTEIAAAGVADGARREESPFCTAEPYDLRIGR